jgi:hypothetical protein
MATRPGHQSLLVRLDAGDVVLAADACYFRETLDELKLRSWCTIRRQCSRRCSGLPRARAVGTRIVYGHDPKSWATMPQGAGRRRMTDGRSA